MKWKSQSTGKYCNQEVFSDLSDDNFHDTIDTFWIKYDNLNLNNYPFGSDMFIWSSKDIRDGNINMCHQKYSLPCTKVLGFVSCRVTSKIPGMGSAEHSWGDVKKIKSGKISDLYSDILYKQSIVYTYP